MKTLTVAVLGANGQLAPVLLRRFTKVDGIKPIAICRNRVGAAMIGDIACETRVGSVTELHEAKELLQDCDVVVNCIWPVVPSREVSTVNQSIICNLSQVSALKRLIHLSSVAVYGCIHERSNFARPRPDTSYGKEKLSLEKFVSGIFAKASRDCFVLRLGHVFGPHQWLSRDIIELANSSRFSLPFNGERPSNAIHVEELALALAWLVSAPIASGTYNLAGNQTWREIFDWHSRICDVPRVQGMSAGDSEKLRKTYIRGSGRSVLMSCLSQLIGWVRSLPVQQLLSSGEVRNVGSALLRWMPLSISTRIKSAKAIREVRREISALEIPCIIPAPWYFSDAMPGRYLVAPLSPAYPEELSRREHDILAWYRAKSGPQWSLNEEAAARNGSQVANAAIIGSGSHG